MTFANAVPVSVVLGVMVIVTSSRDVVVSTVVIFVHTSLKTRTLSKGSGSLAYTFKGCTPVEKVQQVITWHDQHQMEGLQLLLARKSRMTLAGLVYFCINFGNHST